MNIINDKTDYLDKLFDNVYSYPDINDNEFQEKIFKKKEFFNYQVKHRPEINTYNDLEQYRKNATMNFKLAEYQQMLSNYFNPDTPFNSLLLFHGLGTGKTCCAINIASRFYEQIKKYNTRIHILVPGPILKDNWINEIKNSVCSSLRDVNEKQIFELFNILSYKAFNKRVLGEKIRNKDFKNDKTSKYKKNKEGEIMRNESFNKIASLDNTLLIIDEAHNITNNDYGLAVKKIAAVSKNLKILLLTGTPMKNAADDIITLLEIMNISNKNYDKLPQIFTGNNHTLDFSTNGEKVLREQVKGKFSYIAGGDKYLFAIRNDLGVIPKSLKFTKVIPIKFNKEQYAFYKEVVDKNTNGLEKSSSDVCNFILPKLMFDEKKSFITMTFGKEGLDEIINELETNGREFNVALKSYINERNDKKTNDNDLIYVNNKTLTGKFLHRDYLKLFSPKFHQALTNIQNLVEGKKGPRTAFIYSNLVRIGINMFKQVLLQNGYIEFIDTKEKTISRATDDTVCYYCGVKKKEHNSKSHVYYPSTFIVITGDKDDDDIDPEEKNRQKKLVDEVFSSNENREGKYIKLILGSKVISEGYNTKNLMEVHILDVYYNFARVDQAVGRAIRKNSHRYLYSESNPYPVVDVYKYCMVSDIPTNEELLYQKAEKKHAMIKYVEHIIKQEAVDKYLNYEWNNKKIEKCVPLEHGNKYDSQILNEKEKENVCKAENDYLDVSYLTKADKEFIDKINDNKKLVDINTFTNNMIKYEIDNCKDIIKKMFLFKYAYTLEEIIKFVKDNYDNENNFDIYYVYKALDDLVPINDNDFNNIDNNIVIDKYNKIGYLIYINNYYIFQPINQADNIPMYYRIKENKMPFYGKSLMNVLRDNNIINENITTTEKEYDFVSVSNYYNNRKQNDIIGVIDKEPNVKGSKKYSELKDTFKIRDKITIKSNLKRTTGLQSYTGAVCYNAYGYGELLKKLNKLGIKLSKEEYAKKSRGLVCNKMKDVLLNLEKYSNDNTTYCIIPENHPLYEFPYNLKDRSKYIVDKISNKFNVNINVERINDIKGYKISCADGKDIEKEFMIENKFELNGKTWTRIIN